MRDRFVPKSAVLHAWSAIGVSELTFPGQLVARSFGFRPAGEARGCRLLFTQGMANQILSYGLQTFEVVCETEAAEKRLIKLLSGTMALGGLVALNTTRGPVHVGFPTGAEVVLRPAH